jgi:hypothetical protein
MVAITRFCVGYLAVRDVDDGGGVLTMGRGAGDEGQHQHQLQHLHKQLLAVNAVAAADIIEQC